MQTMQMTKNITLTEASCSECGWQGAAEDVPFGRDPWDVGGGAVCYCPDCGMVDDLNFPEGS